MVQHLAQERRRHRDDVCARGQRVVDVHDVADRADDDLRVERLAVELLARKDWIGVTAFDSSATWAVPLQKVINRSTILEAISKVEPGGGTFFYPALQQAYDALLQVKAKLKHVILLSDGHTNAADYQSLVTRMALERITVTG